MWGGVYRRPIRYNTGFELCHILLSTVFMFISCLGGAYILAVRGTRGLIILRLCWELAKFLHGVQRVLRRRYSRVYCIYIFSRLLFRLGREGRVLYVLSRGRYIGAGGVILQHARGAYISTCIVYTFICIPCYQQGTYNICCTYCSEG